MFTTHSTCSPWILILSYNTCDNAANTDHILLCILPYTLSLYLFCFTYSVYRFWQKQQQQQQQQQHSYINIFAYRNQPLYPLVQKHVHRYSLCTYSNVKCVLPYLGHVTRWLVPKCVTQGDKKDHSCYCKLIIPLHRRVWSFVGIFLSRKWLLFRVWQYYTINCELCSQDIT